MKISGIYKIINKVNGKYYVGSSKDIHKRWNQHKSELSSNIHNNDYLQKSWNKYGREQFLFVIVENNVNESDLLKTEQKYINLSNLDKNITYNICCDATSPMKGRKHSKETKIKMSNGKIGIKMKCSFKNLKHSKETKIKMSMGKLGNKNPFYEKKHNEASRKIIRENTLNGMKNAGRKILFSNKKFHWYNKTTGNNEFCNPYDLYTKHNLNKSNVFNVCKGKIPSCKGWIIKRQISCQF